MLSDASASACKNAGAKCRAARVTALGRATPSLAATGGAAAIERPGGGRKLQTANSISRQPFNREQRGRGDMARDFRRSSEHARLPSPSPLAPRRQAGFNPLSVYLTTYKLGDYVDIKVNASVHKGMPHKFYNGKTGRVWNVTKRAIGVELLKQVGPLHPWGARLRSSWHCFG